MGRSVVVLRGGDVTSMFSDLSDCMCCGRLPEGSSDQPLCQITDFNNHAIA